MDGSIVGVSMARRRRRAARPPADDQAMLVADLGPAVRLDEGREGPGRTHAGYRADPDNPKRTVYGARTSPPHHRLLLDQRLTPWQFDAGCRYAGYWNLYEHGRAPDPDAPRTRVAPGSRSAEMAADRAHAGNQLREARRVLGPQGEAVVRAVCVAELPLYRAWGVVFGKAGQEDAGPSQPVRAAVVQGMLVVALDALARRWRLGPRRRA
jgi:hypothetical protein